MSSVNRLFGTVEQWATFVAPAEGPYTDLGHARVDYTVHRLQRQSAQRLRGRVYRMDGAVRDDQLTCDERWEAPRDASVWHLVVSHPEKHILATMWYDEHPPRHLNQMHSFHPATRKQLQAVVDRAKDERLKLAEMGGWVAVSPVSNLLILTLALAMHRHLGPSLAPVIITTRHDASAMLVKHGGAERCGAESYWDERFGCDMELLVVDSRVRQTAYESGLNTMADRLSMVPTLATHAMPVRVSA